MKKQINKVLIALIFSTVVAPAYGSFGKDITTGAAIASATGLLCIYRGAAALIGKTIIDRLSPDNKEEAKNSNANIILSGCIGGFIGAHSSVAAVLGAGSAYFCNAAYDLVFGKDNRDYNSNRTTFISGIIGAAVPALARLTIMAIATLPVLATLK